MLIVWGDGEIFGSYGWIVDMEVWFVDFDYNYVMVDDDGDLNVEYVIVLIGEDEV